MNRLHPPGPRTPFATARESNRTHRYASGVAISVERLQAIRSRVLEELGVGVLEHQHEHVERIAQVLRQLNEQLAAAQEAPPPSAERRAKIHVESGTPPSIRRHRARA